MTSSLRCATRWCLSLPLSPLCAEDCAGLCSTCGVRLADAEPGHAHPDDGGVWAVLKDLFGPEDRGATDDPASNGRPDETTSTGTRGPEGSKEH